jgi:O-antigen ligase
MSSIGLDRRTADATARVGSRLQNVIEAVMFAALLVTLTPNSVAFMVQRWLGILINPGPPAAAILAAIGLWTYARQPKMKGEIHFIAIALAAIGFFCLTGLWSPSRTYLASKLLYTLTLGPTMLVAGLVIGSDQKKTTKLLNWLIGFGIVVSVSTQVFGIEAASAYDNLAVETAHAGYQGISRMLGLSICAASALILSGRHSRLASVLLILSILIFGGNLLATGGRTGIAVIIGFGIGWALPRTSTASRWVLLTLAVAAVAFIDWSWIDEYTTIWATDSDLPQTIQRLSFYLSPLSEIQDMEGSRTFFHSLAIDMFLENPFTGVGWAGFPVQGGYGDVDYIYPHNIVLEVASETGVVGLILLSSLLGSAIFPYWRAMNSDWIYRTAGGMFGAGLSISFIISDFSVQRELMLFVGILVAYNSRGRHAQEISSLRSISGQTAAKM